MRRLFLSAVIAASISGCSFIDGWGDLSVGPILDPLAVLPASADREVLMPLLNDPFALTLEGGGFLEIRSTTSNPDCIGVTTEAPTARLRFTGSPSSVRIFALPRDGDDDLTLAIHRRGTWSCSDDSFGTTSPSVDIPDPQVGEYEVWVGTFGGTAPVTLFVTEYDDIHPCASDAFCTNDTFCDDDGYCSWN